MSGTSARTPASILGVLCRKWYPGIVQLSEEPVVQEPASNWDRYALVTDDTYRNKQERVLAEFWVSLSRTTLLNTLHSLVKSFLEIMNVYYRFYMQKYFRPKGLEEQADRAAAAACRKYVTDMHHEGSV